MGEIVKKVFAWFYSLFFKCIQNLVFAWAVLRNVFAKKYSHANTFGGFE